MVRTKGWGWGALVLLCQRSGFIRLDLRPYPFTPSIETRVVRRAKSLTLVTSEKKPGAVHQAPDEDFLGNFVWSYQLRLGFDRLYRG